MWISGFSGGVAAFVTTPFSLISIRQICDSQTRPEWRRNYGSLGEVYAKSSENTQNRNSLFKGAYANVVRHVLLNISLTAPFDFFQEYLYLRFGDYGFVKPLAMFLAAGVCSIITLPLDNARTRIMNAHSDPSSNRLNYTGIIDVFKQSFKH